MIGAIGYSDYLRRRTLPILQDLNENSAGLCVGTSLVSEAAHTDVRLVSRDDVLSDDTIDCVYVSSATGQHFYDCQTVLDAGKDVLVEKPVCLTAEELDVLDAAARGDGLAVFECLSYPYHPAWKTYLNHVRTHRWSGSVSVTAIFCIPLRPHTDFRMRPGNGGAHADLGTYCLDALDRLAGALKGTVAQPGPVTVSSSGNGGTATACGEIDGSTTATYTAKWGFGHQYINRVTVSDQSAAIDMDRVFSLPPDYHPQIQSRQGGEIVTTFLSAANATRLCIKDGIARTSRQGVCGVIRASDIRRRIAALDSRNHR